MKLGYILAALAFGIAALGRLNGDALGQEPRPTTIGSFEYLEKYEAVRGYGADVIAAPRCGLRDEDWAKALSEKGLPGAPTHRWLANRHSQDSPGLAVPAPSETPPLTAAAYPAPSRTKPGPCFPLPVDAPQYAT
jgi:hypothetical protein